MAALVRGTVGRWLRGGGEPLRQWRGQQQQRAFVGPRGPDGEVQKAQQAAEEPGPTIFGKILDGSIPADIIYKDEQHPYGAAALFSSLSSVRGFPRRGPAGSCAFPGDPKAPHSSHQPCGRERCPAPRTLAGGGQPDGEGRGPVGWLPCGD
ncbi:adenosine 5'-monophosphoramidase HINT2 isoform X2 [Rhineura floridana]|uniref:adenosine 5'-monophosphoramidase HINT2 isoform X2 n=1 Tax=Rhineura floridana TaxID=261503 RepID=UPI002AC87E57|nr:adenosine 5'-monophosphoramidase HINT2 isoform X2 [Rhineura floridana]